MTTAPDELCRFCLVPIHPEASDVFNPCLCKTDTRGLLIDRIYGYCHTACLTDYRIQQAYNACYLRCEDCNAYYNFIIRDLEGADRVLFEVKVNKGVRWFLWFFCFFLYAGFLTSPIFGFMVLWRYTNQQAFSDLLDANDLKLGTWFPYYLLGSLTWGAILGLYWCYCARGMCGPPLHRHSRYYHGYREYYGTYSGSIYYPVFFYGGAGSSGSSGGTASHGDAKALLIVALVFLCLLALVLGGALLYICVELTNLRYKEYMKRTVACKYKVESSDFYDPHTVPATPPPDYVECGYEGWI